MFKYSNDPIRWNTHRSGTSPKDQLQTAWRVFERRKACHPLLDARNSVSLYLNNLPHLNFCTTFKSRTFWSLPIICKHKGVHATLPPLKKKSTENPGNIVLKCSRQPRWPTLKSRAKVYRRMPPWRYVVIHKTLLSSFFANMCQH